MIYNLAEFQVPETKQRVEQLLKHEDDLVAYNAERALRLLRKQTKPRQ